MDPKRNFKRGHDGMTRHVGPSPVEPDETCSWPRHTDDDAVDRFAHSMRLKLARKRGEGYGGWDDPESCTVRHLADLLVKHIEKGDPVDVANFAMMLAHREGGAQALAQAGQRIRLERVRGAAQ